MRVSDDNDNAPIFRFPSYPVTVSETVQPGTIFLTVFASDRDIGSNAELRYAIVEGNTSGMKECSTGSKTRLLSHFIAVLGTLHLFIRRWVFSVLNALFIRH